MAMLIPVGEKLTPPEELMLERGRFISIREAVETVRACYPEMTFEQVAEWVYRKARHLDGVEKTFSGTTRYPFSMEAFFKRVAAGGGEVMSGDDYNTKGYHRRELERVLSMEFPVPLPSCYQDGAYLMMIKDKQDATPPDNIQGFSKLSVANDYEGWEPRFAGKKTAMEIIAALSKVIMEKSGNKYRRGSGVSASAIADSVVETLNKTDSQKYRKLISEALRETKVADAD